MALTKITNRLVGSSLKTAISGSDIAESSSFSTRTTTLESASGSFSTRTTTLESASGSFSTRTTTVEGRVNQGVKTTDSPTFAGATINGTLTASEIHTTFVSSSVATITGSNVFGDAVGDLHSFTGSVSISGSQTSLVTAGNVDFNGDLDVDGTTNLDVVDIDGAVDMASTLTVANQTFIGGTTDEGYSLLLNIEGAGGTDDVPGILFKNTSASNNEEIMSLLGTQGSDSVAAINIKREANADDAYIDFMTQANGGSMTERMRINSSGNVGIGTNSATLLLHVNGGALIRNGSDAGSYFDHTNTNTLNFGYDINSNTGGWVNYKGYQGGTTQFRDFYVGDGKGSAIAFFEGSTSRVGIGTDDPGALLHLHDGGLRVVGSNERILVIEDGGQQVVEFGHSTSATYDGFLELIDDSGTTQISLKSGTGVSYINNGNVGIGTNNPGVQLDIYNTDHAVMRLLAGTNKSASMRLRNDAQDWDVNLQTNDNFAIYDQTLGANALTIAPSTYAATFSGTVTVSRSGAQLTVFDTTVGNKESIVIDRNTANGDDYQEIRWKLQGSSYPGGYIRHDYEDTNNTNLYFGVRDSGTPGTALTIDSSKNSTFSGNVTSTGTVDGSSGLKTQQAQFKRLSSNSLDNNSINDLTQVHQRPIVVRVEDTAGGLSTIAFPIGGAGVAYNWSMLDSDSNSWQSNQATITSTGTNGNTYHFTFNSGSGMMRIQRTNGSLSFTVRIYQMFE